MVIVQRKLNSRFKPPFEAYSGEKPFIFVSYDHADIPVVYPIIENLYDAGMLIWYDEGIPVSTQWLKIIASKIMRCSCFLVFFSNNSINSEHVRDEVFLALERFKKKEIQFVPILLENTPFPDELNLSIGRIQKLNKFVMDDEDFARKLSGQLSTFIDRVPINIRKELNSARRAIKNEHLSITKERMEIEKQLLKRENELYEKHAEFRKIKLELELKYLEEEKSKYADAEQSRAEEKLKFGEEKVTTHGEEFDFQIKIIMMGEGTVGKTTLTEQYINKIFKSNIKRTIGVEFYTKNIEIHGYKIKLTIWDIGGQKGFRFLIPTYCLGSSGAILLYDITRSNSIDDIKSWIETFRSKTRKDTPIILVGNKVDLEKQRVIQREKGNFILETNRLDSFLECSAKTGKNVEEIFTRLTEIMMKRAIVRSKDIPA